MKEDELKKDGATIYCIIQLAFINNVFPDLFHELQKISDKTEDLDKSVDQVDEMTNSAMSEVCLVMKWGKTFCFYGSKGKAGRTKAYDTNCGDYKPAAVFSSLDSRIEGKIHKILSEHQRSGILYGKGMILGEKVEFYNVNRNLWRFLIYLIRIYNKGKGRKDLMSFIDNVYNVYEAFSYEPGIKLSLDCAGVKLSSISDECLNGCINIRKRALKIIEKIPGVMSKVENCIKEEIKLCDEESNRRQINKQKEITD